MADSLKKGSSASGESTGVNNEDYNIRSPERTELLTKIKGVINDAPVSPAFWACCQLADMNRLQSIANIGDKYFILVSEGPLTTLVMRWTQRFWDSGSKAGSKAGSHDPKRRKLNFDGQPSVSRSAKGANNCKTRDGHKCVLTKAKYPEAAHIFPYSMINPPADVSSTTSDFWGLLHLFWDRDQVMKWENTIFSNPKCPGVGIESCFNSISLRRDAHDLWNRGLFALKPLELSPNRKRLTVQFFWQVRGKHTTKDRIDLLTEPTSSEGLDEVEEDGAWLEYRKDDGFPRRPIRSGDQFTFTTEDPEKLPLPSVELLEMQWVLQRLAGMSGAAGWPSLDEYDDDSVDDNDDWLTPDSSVHNSLKRVREWIGAEGAANITPETPTDTSSPAMIECH